MFPGYVKMGGPFGGVIYTSQGIQAVAPDGTFWVPQEDVPSMLRRGAFFSNPGLASVRIGGYSIYENNTSSDLDIQTPDGAIVPFVVGDAIDVVPAAFPVVTKTANYAILSADNQTTFDNAGASGTVVLSLPPAVLGLRFAFIALSTHVLEILAAGGDQITIGTQSSAFGGNAQSSLPYSAISLIVPHGIPNLWVAQSMAGSWQLT